MTPRTTIRDRGLAMISRFNRWLIAGAVAASGLISLTAAHAFHARTASGTGSSSATGSSAGGASASGSGAPAQSPSGQDGSGLSQPTQAPAPAQAAPSPVVSGGS
jgi:hypothetical protein